MLVIANMYCMNTNSLTLPGSACAVWASGGAGGEGGWCYAGWVACGWGGREGAGPFCDQVEEGAPRRMAWNHYQQVTKEAQVHREENQPPAETDQVTYSLWENNSHG